MKIFWKKASNTSIEESWRKQPAALKFDLEEFLNWFDRAGSITDQLVKAKRDFSYRFSQSVFFKNIPKNTALEIGFGGGRLLIEAAKMFRRVYGVDIHEAFETTRSFLQSQNVGNVILLHKNDLESIPNGSIDFIFSFIVFQHFEDFSEIEFYLHQIGRLLSKKGYAHIYFGKNKGKGIRKILPQEFRLRECSLLIEPSFMKAYLENNFRILSFDDNLLKDPLHSGESGQFFVEFCLKV